MTRRTLAERKAFLESLPWVKKLPAPTECDGVKWSTVALRDIFEMNGRPARGIGDRSKCKSRAHWRYVSLESGYARSGNFCYIHTVMHAENEHQRIQNYVARYLKEDS